MTDDWQTAPGCWLDYRAAQQAYQILARNKPAVGGLRRAEVKSTEDRRQKGEHV
jgi:hypothetical protein